MTISIALGIPHTPWKADRRDSLMRLTVSLPIEEADHRRIFSDREPNWSWSARMWGWAVETDATHFLSLQDDAIVAPDFWRHLRAMIHALPDSVIGLESAHPTIAELKSGWCTTSDMLIGVGYVMPMRVLRSFLAWRTARLCKGAVESITEDTLLALWCLVSGLRIWHPIPTIIDHDVSLPSTYGNDAHQHRRPAVTWKDRSLRDAWDAHAAWAHLGQFYNGRVAMLGRRWISGATDEDWERWRAA